MRVIAVSASNSGYFGLLRGWIASIRDKPESNTLSIGVLDVGLVSEEVRSLEQIDVTVVRPDWDFDLGRQKGAPEYYKAQVARPFLTKYFPGYDVYIWMDADTWVQRWWVFDLMMRAVEKGSMPIVPEVDRAYRKPETELRIERYLGVPYRITSYSFRRYRDIYGTDVAKKCFDLPVLNAGVFALAADAPHWEVWRREYQKGLLRSKRPGLDQISLGYVCAQQCVPFEFLPALCNWVVHLGCPAFDSEHECLVEPYLPHREIAVIHTSMRTKNTLLDVPTLDGGMNRMTLRYSGASNRKP